MKVKPRQQMATAGLVLALAAVGTPAAQAAFPDGDSPASPTQAQAGALAERVRSEPAPPAIETSFSLDAVAGGFDWGDAGIGAAMALGAAAFLTGTVVVVRRSGGRNRLSTP
jgi:hypothetical protein